MRSNATYETHAEQLGGRKEANTNTRRRTYPLRSPRMSRWHGLRIHPRGVQLRRGSKLVLPTADDPPCVYLTHALVAGGAPSFQQFFDAHQTQAPFPIVQKPLFRKLPDKTRSAHYRNTCGAGQVRGALVSLSGSRKQGVGNPGSGP